MGRVGFDQFAIGFKRAEEGFRAEFHFLRDVALNQRDTDRLADRAGPGNLAQPEAAQGEQRQGQCADPPAQQQGTAKRDQQAQSMHTKDGRKAGQRARGSLRITQGQPGKAGEHPASDPVGRGDQYGEVHGLAPQSAGRPALEKPAGECRIKRHESAEDEGGGRGEPERHAAEDRQADVNPRYAAKKEAQAETEAAQRRLAWRAGQAKGAEQPEPDERRQPEQAERRKAQHAGRTAGGSKGVRGERVPSQ